MQSQSGNVACKLGPEQDLDETEKQSAAGKLYVIACKAVIARPQSCAGTRKKNKRGGTLHKKIESKPESDRRQECR
jgi:hypothetical protein